MHRLLKGLLAGTAALALAATGATTASAAQPILVNRGLYSAVGDSFAAGVGNPTLPGAGASFRSADAYPVLLAGKANKVTFLAASGATTLDVMAQVAYVPSGARQITVTVGGNDGGAFSAMAYCLALYSSAIGSNPPVDPMTDPTVAAACAPLLNPVDDQAADAQVVGIAGLLATLQMQAPQAKIYVTGYPKLFDANDSQMGACTVESLGALPGGLFDALDVATGQLNGRIADAAGLAASQGVDVEFVPVSFADHGLCDGAASWILGPGTPAPLHPNTAGQEAYAQAIVAAGFASSAMGS